MAETEETKPPSNTGTGLPQARNAARLRRRLSATWTELRKPGARARRREQPGALRLAPTRHQMAAQGGRVFCCDDHRPTQSGPSG